MGNFKASLDNLEQLKIYSSVVEHMSNEVHIWKVVRDDQGKIITWKLTDANPAALKSWGEELDKVVGKTTDEIFEGAEPTKTFMPIVEKIFSENQPHYWQTYFNGTNQILDMISIPVGDYFISTGIDITEKKQADNFIDQAHRMESLGILAGGVAHDINNILAIILGNAQFLAKKEKEESLKVHIDSIIEAGQKGKDLASLILSFASDETDSQEEIDLIKNLKAIVHLLESSLSNNMSVRFDSSVNVGPIMGNKIHINQIILNIANNAISAMKEKGGTLTFSLVEKDVPENQIPKDSLGIKAGCFVCLKIADTGEGIPEEVLKNIFEPFFTTKKSGKGSGLGLSIVKTLVKNHGGFISIDTKIGEGTEFCIAFPVNY